MNFTDKIINTIKKRNSALCVGLDVDPAKMPAEFKNKEDGILKFNKAIIDATSEHVAAYKPNMAFYEQFGTQGIEIFEKTLDYIDDDIFVIADAKRGDIGNTSKKYASAFFDMFKCDAVTVSPYMGEDSVVPFLEKEDKGVFILALTSNSGSHDFQMMRLENGKFLYQHVIEMVKKWNSKKNCGIVTGATHPEMFKNIRKTVPEMPFLIPGIGAQGGDLEKTLKFGSPAGGMNSLINSSRGIIYASSGSDFAEKASQKAAELKNNINNILNK